MNNIFCLLQGKAREISQVLVPCSNQKILLMESVIISLRSLPIIQNVPIPKQWKIT